MASSTPESPFMLPQVPRELRGAIFSHLETCDIKNLRATCSALKEVIHLRIDRVFLSANHLNIQVFRAIADHDTFRRGVTEIVWDDARLSRGPELEEQRFDYIDDDPDDIVADNACPLWFKKGRQETWCQQHGCETPDETLGLEESWAYYKTLLQDQDEVLASNADIEAFKYGLQRFPSLTRVTITPATHGNLWLPLYKTPMIRAFPRGFDYPIPRGWPNFEHHTTPIDALPWDDADGDDTPYQQMYGVGCSAEKYREKWRGFRAITRTLAESGEDHHVTELIIGGNQIGTGVNCHVFDQQCAEYENLATLLRRPGFRRISLDLFTGLLEHEEWVSYRSGYLHDALAQAKDLEHVCLRSSMDIADGGAQQLDFYDDLDEYFLPLRTIFPIDNWPRLQHFGLSQVFVQLDDLVSLLAALPASLRSVELSHLGWGRQGDNYMNLLVEMRDFLDWRTRPAEERPTVAVAVSSNIQEEGRVVWVDKAVGSFLYGDGENPFQDENISFMVPGRGGIERDMFDPSFARPY